MNSWADRKAIRDRSIFIAPNPCLLSADPAPRSSSKSRSHQRKANARDKSAAQLRQRKHLAVKPRILDWVVTIPFLLAFAIVLLVFDVAQRVARIFGKRPQEYAAGGLQVALVWAFRLTGTRVRVERSEHIKPHGSYLFLGNHQSLFDIPIIGAALFTNFPKYVSKKELARWLPSISYNLRRGGNALIERGDRTQATEAIRENGRPGSGTGCFRGHLPRRDSREAR